MVKCLISINPNTCFIRDNQGMNPIHVAAERGYCEILNELIEVSPDAARVRVGGAVGDTVMHLCVKHNKLDALKLLANKVGDVMMLNAKDVDGNTMLHVAVIRKRLEMTKFLLDDSRIDKSVLNSDGLTPMDIHKSQQQQKQQQHVDVDFIDKELENELKTAHALTAAKVGKNQKSKYFGEWIEKERSSLMIVASLIAAIAFQGCLNPPGGVWQDNNGVTYDGFGITPAPTPSLDDDFHVAGTAIAAYGSLSFYFFIIFNSIGLFSSMIGLFLLISGLPWKKTAVIIVMVLMWIALASMTVAYLFAMIVLTMIPTKVEKVQPNSYTIEFESFTGSFGSDVIFLGIVGCVFMILFLHFALGMMKLARKLRSGRGH